MKRVVALSFVVAACGGKSKPAPDPVEEKKVVEPPSDTEEEGNDADNPALIASPEVCEKATKGVSPRAMPRRHHGG